MMDQEDGPEMVVGVTCNEDGGPLHDTWAAAFEALGLYRSQQEEAA